MNIARLMTVASLLASAGALAQSPEVEPNNSVGTAGAVFAVPCERTGVISPTNDVDYYAISVPAGASLRIRATPTSHTCTTSDLVVTVVNSSSMTVATNDDAPGMFLCPELDASRDAGVANMTAGTYYVAVNNINNAPNVAYTLTVQIVHLPQPLAAVFTYQGVLTENGVAVNGQRDITVSLWNHPTTYFAENRVGSPLLVSGVTVTDGKFVLPLDFGSAAMDGTERYAEVEVAANGSGPGGVAVTPRQRLTPTPHAVYALKAGYAATAGSATSATTANSAGTAYSAQLAEWADYATAAGQAQTAITAGTASQTPWNGITGMPLGFADGNDADGPWNTNGIIAYYTAGAVGIGTTNPGSFTFAVSGSAAKTGGGAWSVFCDSRLKHDIAPLTGTLDKLLGLRGYTFQYNQAALENNLALPGTQIGLMAEEVERVFPDWVEKDAKGYRYVTERSTTALMVEALRDLRAEKDAAIAQKQSQIDALNARLDRLEKAMQK